MAGAYWHFYTANKFIETEQESLFAHQEFRCIIDFRPQFLAGVQGPDFNFYPGGNLEISSLAHGQQPADLGRSLLRRATTNEEKAFAYGWLMHLTTDIITHPLVNQLIMKYFPRQTSHGTDYQAYPLGHHRVEWGIDLALLQEANVIDYLPQLDDVLNTAKDVTPLVQKAYDQVFGYDFKEADWLGAVSGMVNYMAIFEKAWKWTGRLKDRNPLKQFFKQLGYQVIVNPLAKVLALRNPENGAGVFIPIQAKKEDLLAVLNRSNQVVAEFTDHLSEQFINLPNNTG